MPSQEEFNDLYDVLFSPKDYRKAFKDNAEEGEEPEIFEILKEEIVQYAKNNDNFRDFLVSKLGLKPMESSRPTESTKSTSRFSPRIRSAAQHSFRSSRPTFD